MADKERLIILISSSEAGGAQVYILNLVEHLKALYNVVVVCPAGYLYERLVKNNVEVVQCNIGLLKISFIRKFLLQQQKQYERVIVNTHLLGTTFWTVLSSFFTKQYRLVSTLHQPIIYNDISTFKKVTFPIITRYVAKHVDDFISVSQEIADSVFVFTKREAYYVPNSVPDIAAKKVVAVAAQDDEIKVGIVGRLTPQKNHFCFLKAAKLIAGELAGVHFYIIGDGELRQPLQEQVIKDKLGNYVTFTGFVDEPASLVKELDYVVFSSDFEGTPLALLETMSIGVPIIATKVGGIPQVIEDGVDGLLVPPGEPEAIKDAVLKLYRDQELYKEISRNSIMKIRTEFSYEDNVQFYVAILNGER